MTKLPVISSKEVIKALAKIGYYIDHQKGSHISLAHPIHKTITIPKHKVIKKGLLKKILRDANLSNEDLIILYKREVKIKLKIVLIYKERNFIFQKKESIVSNIK